ncbi:hypothetical protein DR864_16235 [Runella rosea]|uniref:Colicin D immunity protein domain-containing protein n=1 Tax=Runella rosea TaxID=2259595 RepID=A0A344TKL8_9BACT|nr:hypothetical protein DR864_16235 [Runella rosea]
MTEQKYKLLIDNYLNKGSSVEKFTNAFFQQWKHDRDNEIVHDSKFQRLIDRLFTSCDCYSENLQRPIEISETELRNEVGLLSHIWWG